MTSVSQKRATFISQRLEFLQDQGDQLNKVVGEYVSQIIQTCQFWTEGGKNKMGFLELCQMVDSAVDFLWRKCEEISGGSVSVAENQLSQTSCEQPDLTSQSTTATTSTSTIPHRRLASLLASTTASSRQLEEPVQPTDEIQLKPVLARIAVIEEAWCSLRSNAEKFAEQQSYIDQQIKELLSKLSESDKKHNSKFRKVREQISEINDTQVALDQEQETRLQSLEKQLQKLSTAQDRMKEEMESQTELTEKQLQKLSTARDRMKEEMESQTKLTEKQLQKLSMTQDRMKEEVESQTGLTEKQLQKLSTAQDRMKEEMESQTELTEKQLQKLSTTQDRMKEVMESQTELTEKLVHVPDQLESVEEKLDVLDARIGRIMDDCSNTHQDIEHVTRDLADKVKANTETVQVISVDQDQKTTLLRELETRMQTLEADSGRNVKDVQKQAEKGETNLRILCQMLNDRLTPLEQLRTSLNERASTRDENIRQLTQVIQEVAVMSPRLQQLELKSSRTRCGFTARAELSEQATGVTVRAYYKPRTNVGANFDADSGIFTAPVDGLYVAAISVRLQENGNLVVSVRHTKQGQILPTPVCWCRAEVKDTQACNVGVVNMKAGDILFVHVYSSTTKGLWDWVNFSSFLLA